MNETTTDTAADLKHRLRTSALISRMVDKPLQLRSAMKGAIMAEPTTSAAATGLLIKLIPAGFGALIMVVVTPPETKRELFARLFVAFTCSYLFGDVVFDVLRSFPWLSALDPAKRAHTSAIDGLLGAFGWFLLGGVSMWMKRFRADPTQAVKDAKEAVR